ncbi:CLUMA_CG018510, isoform A [Clunio marinus]|uniref:CLUMA_CG018510, isoform A n=1 Tax=Clunio marinus TaxID=568069 RepID=A0A1J1IXZ1_9DIPT|nr:CLUMA_CG018510, isoform A [Clunio marinus]
MLELTHLSTLLVEPLTTSNRYLIIIYLCVCLVSQFGMIPEKIAGLRKTSIADYAIENVALIGKCKVRQTFEETVDVITVVTIFGKSLDVSMGLLQKN